MVMTVAPSKKAIVNTVVCPVGTVMSEPELLQVGVRPALWVLLSAQL